MVTRATLAWVVLLTGLLHSGTAHAGAAGPRVAIVQAGVEVSLTVQRRTYPRNAVIRADLRVRNVTHHWVELEICPSGPATVGVRDATGTVLYPPAVPLLAQTTCPPTSVGPQLAPGRVLEQKRYVLLRAPQLDALAAVRPYNTQVWTPTLKLRLVPAPAPRVMLHTEGRVYATIRSTVPVRGPLLFSQSYHCRSGLIESNFAAWDATWKGQIRPGCAHVVEWHAVAGWLNHPVAFIDFVKRQDQPRTKAPKLT